MEDSSEQQYRAGALVVGAESPTQELIEQIRAGVESDYSDFQLDPHGIVNPELQSFDPRTVKREPKAKEAWTLAKIIELCVIYETGPLGHPVHVARGLDVYGMDLPLFAWLWLTTTEGWNEVTHEVFRHLYVRGKTWDQWPAHHSAIVERVTVNVGTEKEPVLNETIVMRPRTLIKRKFAALAWAPFIAAVEARFDSEPFDPRPQDPALEEIY